MIEGDVLDAEPLRGAGDGVEVAYYLVHAMGRGSDGDFEAREREAARNFARMARSEGIERVVYLGSNELQGLAREVKVSAQPPQALVLLDRALHACGSREGAVRLLRRAQAAYPADFWINQNLGAALRTCRPPQFDEAIR